MPEKRPAPGKKEPASEKTPMSENARSPECASAGPAFSFSGTFLFYYIAGHAQKSNRKKRNIFIFYGKIAENSVFFRPEREEATGRMHKMREKNPHYCCGKRTGVRENANKWSFLRDFDKVMLRKNRQPIR